MNIFKGLPSEPGWYWIRLPEGYRDEFDPEWKIEYLRIYVNQISLGNCSLIGFARYEEAEYVGPLVPPNGGEKLENY